MNISIIARQVNIRDDLKVLTEKKLAKFDRYFPRGADAAVTFRRIRDDECVEITISVGGTLFRAEETTAEFRTSLTRCIDTIEGQIRKNKTRLEKRMKSTFAAAEAAMEEAAAAPAVEEELVDDLELVAVISAALAAYRGPAADGFVVRSIKRSKTNKWKKA